MIYMQKHAGIQLFSLILHDIRPVKYFPENAQTAEVMYCIVL